MTIAHDAPRLAVTLVRLREAVPSPLRRQVVDILRTAITECVFEPGGRLVERDLCERLGVSRPTLREGLRQLEAEGLLHLEPNKGPVVPALSPEQAEAVYAVRRKLEGYACEQCARHVTDGDLKALAASLGLMTRAMRDDDFKLLQRAKTEFYSTLYEVAGNLELKEILQRLRARVTLIRGLDVNRTTRMRESVDGARAILGALGRRDPDSARRTAEKHMDRAAALALEAARSMARGASGHKPRIRRR